MPKKVVVLTGTPGVGKSSVSMRLAEKLGASCIDLNKLIVEEELIQGYDEGRETSVADLSKIRRRLRNTIRQASGSLILVEGHLAHLVVPKEVVEMAFVLRCHPDVLRRRLEGRGYTDAKIVENLQAEVLDVCLVEALEAYGRRKVSEIDLTDKGAEEAALEAYETLMGLRKPLVGSVDWLLRLQTEGKLEDYLRSWVGGGLRGRNVSKALKE